MALRMLLKIRMRKRKWLSTTTPPYSLPELSGLGCQPLEIPVTYVEIEEGPGTEEGETMERKMNERGYASQLVTSARRVHLTWLCWNGNLALS